MLRFTLFTLAIILVSIVLFGCKMQSMKVSHVDHVSQIEAFMNAR